MIRRFWRFRKGKKQSLKRFNNSLSHRRVYSKRIIFFVLLVILVGLILVTLFSSLLIVKTIEVDYGSLLCNSQEEIEKKLNIRGRSIVFLNSRKIEEEIEKEFLCVKDVRVQKVYPDKAEVLVIPRVPKLIVANVPSMIPPLDLQQLESTPSSSAALLDFEKVNSEFDKFLVDEEGVVFFKNLNVNLVNILFIERPISIGQKLDKQIINEIMNILKILEDLGSSVELVKVNQADGLLIENQNGQRFIFSLQKDTRGQIASLQLILQKNKIESRGIKSIDLRFSKPVVVYTK